MNKLLSAEFVRLFKSMIFRVCMLFSAGLGAFLVLMRWLDVKKHPSIYEQLGVECSNADGLVFTGGIYLIFAMAVFIGIFVGTEYSDGTIRNKLTAGHTRGSIYLSKLIVCAAADIMIHFLYIVVVLIVGNLFIGGTTIKVTEALLFTLGSTAAVLAFTAILLLFSMLIQSKAAGSVVCLLATIIMLFATMMIWQRLSAPEYYEAYSYVDEDTGKTVSVEREKNPKYLEGTKREVYEFLNNVLPVSQIYQIVMNISDNIEWMALYDGIIIVVTTGVGMVVFKKKNLK